MVVKGVRSKVYQQVNLDDHDNSERKSRVLGRTENQYDRTLSLFDDFLELHPKASDPPDIRTYKGFMEFVSKNTRGRLGEYPTPETMEGFRRRFESALRLRRDYDMPNHISTTIRDYIANDLKETVPLCEDEMPKDSVSPNDLMIILTHLWCRDFKEYRGKYPDRSRVQLSASLLLYCFTSARTGEVHESTARRELSRKKTSLSTSHGGDDGDLEARVLAACYKHFILTIEWVDGIKMLVLTYSRVYVKGYWKKKRWQLPIHGFYEIYKTEAPLFFNLLTFFLPMACADRVFMDYTSVGEIMDAAENMQGDNDEKIIAKLELRPEMENIPIFRPYDEQAVEDSTGRSRGADSFGKELAELGHRAGYTENITGRACRRWALMEADKSHSETARMKFAGHVNKGTFGRSYAHPLSEVDGPATYLGIPGRHEHIQNRRSMGIHRHPQLWQSLPAKAEFEFQERPDIIELDRQMQCLTDELSKLQDPISKKKVQLGQHRIYNEKQRLYIQELRTLQRTQRRTLVIQPTATYEQTLFNYTRKVMPERDLLAQLLPRNDSLRSPTGRAALEALEAICAGRSASTYGAGMQSVNGECLCGRLLTA
eukprot:XP_001395717.2 hypothetical protein ANI_1_2012104 [Aspergillus niger CBS 513.88]